MRDRKASRPGGLEWAASKARAARCSGVPCAVVALTGGAVCAGSELAKKVSARTAEVRNLKYRHTILSSRLVFRSNRHEFTPRRQDGISRSARRAATNTANSATGPLPNRAHLT